MLAEFLVFAGNRLYHNYCDVLLGLLNYNKIKMNPLGGLLCNKFVFFIVAHYPY